VRRGPETPHPGPDDLALTPTGLRFRGRRFPCAIGRGGIRRAKREGDGATPAGIHRIVACLYRPDRLPRAAVPDWAVPLRPFDLWCDDPAHPAYNQLVRAPFPASAERLVRPDPLYDLILTTDWNWPVAHPGRGSAIFIHVWRKPGHPTAGCVALARDDLLWIARRITCESRLFVPASSGRKYPGG
jgi:L,D-peptidoglycan transpeptidase YkuD (ErfK/YbiS/YcfS/YnhG family)